MGQPLILLADESAGNQNSKNGNAVMDLIRELRAAATICTASRDPRYAQMTPRSVYLFDGQAVSEDEAQKHAKSESGFDTTS